MNRLNPDRRGAGSFRPTIETLEDRCLPTVNFAVFGNTLVAFAPTAPKQGGDTIVFRDNGSQKAGNVIAISGAPFVPQVPIVNVIVVMTGPDESVTYNLAGNLTGTRNVSVSLMNGTDAFAALVSGNLLANANLSFSVAASPSTVNGVKGTAQITGIMIGNVLANATLSWVGFAAAGASTLSFQEVGNVASGGVVSVNQFGGTGVNRISTFYAGQMNGFMADFTVGGPKADGLTTDLEFGSGSSGTLNPSLMLGLGDNDILKYVVHNAGQGVTITTNPILDGGSGKNISVRTTNVLSFNCQTDNIVA
jgi:hypothetical protein